MKKLKSYEDKALSDTQLMNMIDGRARLILYPQISEFKTLDQLLGIYKACIILFESKPNYGHWCCVFREGNNVEFFNPYGGYPDDALNFIPIDFRVKSNQLIPELSLLLIKSPYNLSYNEHAFQEMEENVKTCGRHCAMRLIYRDLSLESYYNLINKLCDILNINPDGVVTFITEKI